MKYGGGIGDLLSKVTVKSLSLIADADSSVRRECAKFLGLLLQNTPPVSQCCWVNSSNLGISNHDSSKGIDSLTSHELSGKF